MKLMKKSTIIRRSTALALAAAMTFSLAACGNSSEGGTEKRSGRGYRNSSPLRMRTLPTMTCSW